MRSNAREYSYHMTDSPYFRPWSTAGANSSWEQTVHHTIELLRRRAVEILLRASLRNHSKLALVTPVSTALSGYPRDSSGVHVVASAMFA